MPKHRKPSDEDTMEVIYIAGPFRAKSAWDVEQNIRRAEELALTLWRMGYAVICPHTNTRFFTGAARDDIWLKGDIAIMLRCDAVMMVSGWERSQGAIKERALATLNDIPVFEDTIQLQAWALPKTT